MKHKADFDIFNNVKAYALDALMSGEESDPVMTAALIAQRVETAWEHFTESHSVKCSNCGLDLTALDSIVIT